MSVKETVAAFHDSFTKLHRNKGRHGGTEKRLRLLCQSGDAAVLSFPTIYSAPARSHTRTHTRQHIHLSVQAQGYHCLLNEFSPNSEATPIRNGRKCGRELISFSNSSNPFTQNKRWRNEGAVGKPSHRVNHSALAQNRPRVLFCLKK